MNERIVGDEKSQSPVENEEEKEECRGDRRKLTERQASPSLKRSLGEYGVD